MVDLTEAQDLIAQLKNIPTKDELYKMLQENVVEVTFTKLNGDERVMPCTLIPDYLPPAKKNDPITQEKVRKVSDEVVAVWAMEANAFRSFRYDRVKAVRTLDWHIGEENC
jgi:hypothetical protein